MRLIEGFRAGVKIGVPLVVGGISETSPRRLTSSVPRKRSPLVTPSTPSDEGTALRAEARRHGRESWQAIALGGGERDQGSDVPAREGQPRVLLQGVP